MTIVILIVGAALYALFALPAVLGRIVQRSLDEAKRHRPP